MKKLILSLLLITPLANAQLTLEDCQKVEKDSAVIMKLRQEGVDYSHMYKLANGNKLVISMINHAYDGWPQFQSKDFKQRAINEYKEYYFRSCVKNVTVD